MAPGTRCRTYEKSSVPMIGAGSRLDLVGAGKLARDPFHERRERAGSFTVTG